MAFKDPDRQRAYQAARVRQNRSGWLAKQRCSLCGASDGLRVFRHSGAPKPTWKTDGPSHSQLTVRCGDVGMCLSRQGCEPTPQPKPHRRHATVRSGKVAVVEFEGERALSRLEADMAKPDRRAVCEVHGPRDKVRVNDEWRFVCCARVVCLEGPDTVVHADHGGRCRHQGPHPWKDCGHVHKVVTEEHLRRTEPRRDAFLEATSDHSKEV